MTKFSTGRKICCYATDILVICLFSYRYPDNITPDTEDVDPKPMVIGTNNVFEVGCCILRNNLG